MPILHKPADSAQCQTPPSRFKQWLRLFLVCTLLASHTTLGQEPATPPAADPATPPTTQPAAEPESSSAPVTETKPEPVERRDRQPPELEMEQMRLLASQVEPHQVQWLETPDERFLSLYQPDISGSPIGAVILLHADGEHSNWPQTLEVIRSILPHHGWASLSVSLPAPEYPQPPERELKTVAPANNQDAPDTPATANLAPDTTTPATTSNEETGAKDTTTDTTTPNEDATATSLLQGDDIPPLPPGPSAEQRATDRIRTAITFLHDQGQFNIALIGDGIGAARGAAVLSAMPAPPPQAEEPPAKVVAAMIIINARNRLPLSEPDVAQLLFDPDIPTLDIYSDSDIRNQPEATVRRNYARQQRFRVYQQIELPEPASRWQEGENQLERRIRGFLSRYAQGAEIKNARIIKQ